MFEILQNVIEKYDLLHGNKYARMACDVIIKCRMSAIDTSYSIKRFDGFIRLVSL